MDFKEWIEKYGNKPFKLNKPQKEFIKKFKENPGKRLIITVPRRIGSL